MKLKSMTSLITKSALVLAACASLNAFAGPAPSGKAPAPPVEEDGALFDTIGATLEVGYDSRYYYRGYWFADNTVWTGLSLSIPLTEQLSLGLGGLYTGTADTTVAFFGAPDTDFQYRELDLSASLTYDAGFAKIGLVYTHYEFFDTFSGEVFGGFPFGGPFGDEFNATRAEEVGITAAAPIGPVNIYAGWFYDFTVGGCYAEVGIDYPIEITSWLSLVPAVKAGYGWDYYSGVTGNPLSNLPGAHRDGLTHILYSISAPVKLTRTATLTPYIALNSTGRARINNGLFSSWQNNEVFGGVKLGVTF